MSRVNTFTLPKDPTYITGPNARRVVSTNAFGASSSSTSNVILYSILIPAGTFSVNEVLDVRTLVQKSGDNGTITLRFYVNTTPAIGGTQFGIATYIEALQDVMPFSRRLAIRSSTNSTIVFRTTTSTANDIYFFNASDNYYSSSTGGVESISINWTIDNYIVVGGQLSSGLDIMRAMFLKINN